MSTEIAWAAGLFERGGSVSRQKGRPPRLQFKSANQETVERFAVAVGRGLTYGPYGPYASQMGNKTYYLWIADGTNAIHVANLMSPYLSADVLARFESAFGETNEV